MCCERAVYFPETGDLSTWPHPGSDGSVLSAGETFPNPDTGSSATESGQQPGSCLSLEEKELGVGFGESWLQARLQAHSCFSFFQKVEILIL